MGKLIINELRLELSLVVFGGMYVCMYVLNNVEKGKVRMLFLHAALRKISDLCFALVKLKRDAS